MVDSAHRSSLAIERNVSGGPSCDAKISNVFVPKTCDPEIFTSSSLHDFSSSISALKEYSATAGKKDEVSDLSFRYILLLGFIL